MDDYIQNTRPDLTPSFWGFIKPEISNVGNPKDEKKIKSYFQEVAKRFQRARPLALNNTDYYL